VLKDRLHLVVTRVAGRDRIGVLFARGKDKELVTHFSGSLFDTETHVSRHRRHIAFARDALHTQRLALLTNPPAVRL